jgi:hypothetical protein
VEIHESAHRHGFTDEDVLHAVEHPVAVVDFDPDSNPPKVLVIGPDRAGNMLEVIILLFNDDRILAVHAMTLRKKFYRLLEGTQGD